MILLFLMEHHRTLKVTLQYANDLHRVNLFPKMDVFALVSISGGDKRSTQETKTPSDPSWCFAMKFTVEEAALQQDRLFLSFKLVCRRALGDKAVGEAHVPVKELLDSSTSNGPRAGGKKFVSYQVRKPSGKPKGHLTFSYHFVWKNAPGATVSVGPGAVYPTFAPAGCLPPPSWFYPLVVVAAERGGGYYLPPLGGGWTLRGCYLPAGGGYLPFPKAVDPLLGQTDCGGSEISSALPPTAATRTSSSADLGAN